METRAYAVKRYVFRLGHAQRSGRYATSIEQLVMGLAPVMGWRPVPQTGAERARFVRAHRRSVQRWLDDLQMAGLVAHEPERDTDGKWWRTQIVLLGAPEPTDKELRVARRRARRWSSRERGRRKRRRIAPSLNAIRERSTIPTPGTQARVARGRAIAAQRTRRRAAVEAQIAGSSAVRGVCRDLTHPFGAPPPSALSWQAAERALSSETSQGEGSAPWQAVQATSGHESSAADTGARERVGGDQSRAGAGRQRACTKEVTALSREDFDALVARRLAAREQAWAWRSELLTAQVTRRVADVMAWAAERVCPLGRLREAWVAQRYGLAIVVESGTAAAGSSAPGLASRVARAIALYEAFATERPPGWPASGPGALCALASLGAAERFAGDVARLLVMAKGMRAIALVRDQARIDRARRRAEVRRSPRPSRFVFRTAAPRWEGAEQRRVRVRDAVLLDGGNPASWPNAALAITHLPALRAALAISLMEPDRFEELDGFGARAARYRAELARGRWRPPDRFCPDVTQSFGGTTR